MEKHNEAMLKKIGRGLFLSDGSKLKYMSSDLFQFFTDGKCLLLLEFQLRENKGKIYVKTKRFLLIDKGADDGQ